MRYLVQERWSEDNETGTILASILFGLAVFLGLSRYQHTSVGTSNSMIDSDFPLLSMHAPTLHQSTLKRALTDLVVAHLDPETAGAWDDWVLGLEIRSDQTKLLSLR